MKCGGIWVRQSHLYLRGEIEIRCREWQVASGAIIWPQVRRQRYSFRRRRRWSSTLKSSNQFSKTDWDTLLVNSSGYSRCPGITLYRAKTATFRPPSRMTFAKQAYAIVLPSSFSARPCSQYRNTLRERVRSRISISPVQHMKPKKMHLFIKRDYNTH